MPFDTSILYLDEHEDTLEILSEDDMGKIIRLTGSLEHGHIYPCAPLEPGRGVPLIGYFGELNGAPSYDAHENESMTPHYLDWEPAKNRDGKTLRQIAERFDRGIRQLHVDPDMFSYEGLLRLAGLRVPPIPKRILHKYDPFCYFDGERIRYTRNPGAPAEIPLDLVYEIGGTVPSTSSTFRLIKIFNPDFLGLFEFYAHKAKGTNKEFARRVINRFAHAMKPKHIVIDRSILRNIPALKEELGSMAEIINGPGYCSSGRSCRAYSREPDLKGIMKEGKTFGAFASHISALLTWDTKAFSEHIHAKFPRPKG